MILYFDKETLHLNVKLGALESYQPSEEIKAIVAKADDLRAQSDLFHKTVIEPDMKLILDAIDKINIAAHPQLEELRKKQNK
jgi:hypothetical protein